MRRALLGINASVMGILLAALFQPVWQTGIRGVLSSAWRWWLKTCVVGEPVNTGGAVLRRSGRFDPGNPCLYRIMPLMGSMAD